MKKKLVLLCLLTATCIAQAQNVGIGTTTPAFKLDVKNGSINTDSVYRIGSTTVLAVPEVGNLFIGKDAGMINTGFYNTFSGNLAGLSNTTGGSNSFFGQTAGSSNTTGDHNSFFGRSTGAFNTTGYSNSFFGRSAAYANTTGNYNTAIGNSSLTANTTGTLNTALGYNANVNTSAPTNATAIGANARADCDNCLVLGSVNGINGAASGVNVGIGTTAPTQKLDIDGTIRIRQGNPGAGKTLISDAAGNASWQERSAGGAVGFGSWGDCSMNGISEYNPVADANGESVDNFGQSVSISGNFAIIGAPYDDLAKGSASIYQYDGSNWVFIQKLIDATGVSGDLFGSSVSVSGNYAIVGALYDVVGANSNQGSASTFQYNGSSWVLMQKITDAAGVADDFFGISVSISGIYAIIGALGDDEAIANQGSASVYIYNGISWLFMQKITDATGASMDFFGNTVSISNNYAIVGAPEDDGGAGSNQGSASIYQYNGSSWVLMQKITDFGGAANDYFGYSVSISGNYVITSSYFDNAGQGSVSFYQYNGSSWVLMQKTNNPGGADDNFGTSVSISGNYAIVGALADDVGTNGNQGSATIYVRVGAGWQKLQYVIDPGGTELDYLGTSISIDGVSKRFLIGVPKYAFQSGKVVFGKIN